MASDRASRRLVRHEMGAAARLHRASFDDRLPWLAGLHSPAEDAAFFNDVVFARCEVWGTFENGHLIGFVAFKDGWVEQLYVDPQHHGRGVGSELLLLAQRTNHVLDLWTFVRNEGAISFYRARGFVEVERSDGSRNEEREPDVRLRWHKSSG